MKTIETNVVVVIGHDAKSEKEAIKMAKELHNKTGKTVEVDTVFGDPVMVITSKGKEIRY